MLVPVSRRVLALAAVAAVGGLLGLATSADAQVNVAAGKPVVGGSGSWNGAAPGGNPYDMGQFNALQVTDGIGDADGNNNGGPINEPAQAGFWLGKEGDVTEDFVVDLQAATAIGQIELLNTHNAQFNDRATGGFQIFASNDVAPRAAGETGAGGVDLVNPVLIAAGTLTLQTQANDPVEPETFTSLSATPYRYIRFNTLTPAVGAGNVGLNEIRVFEVPEPAAFGLIGLAGAAALLRRSRRHRV